MEQKNAQVMYKHISFYFNSDVCVFMAVQLIVLPSV